MKKTENRKELFEIRLPQGCLCEEGLCGECIFLDLDRPGSSGRTYYCTYHGKYKEPGEGSLYMCSHFRHR